MMSHDIRSSIEQRDAFFHRIYSTDLRYIPECFRLCGDAHCCSFARYKRQFAFIGRTPFQELPLLPGEYEYLKAHGYLEQFGDYDLKTVDFSIAQGNIRYQSIVSRREGCACDQATRPTICRLYPLYPRFHPSGALAGIDSVGIYEELERIEQLEKACRIERIPVDEVSSFIGLAAHIGADPIAAFHMEAFQLTKGLVAETVRLSVAASGRSAFKTFETMLLRAKLVDRAHLRERLEDLASQFAAYHGPHFSLATTRASSSS